MNKGKHEKPRPHRDTWRMQMIELFQVKSIMSLALVGAMIWGFMHEMVSSEVFVGIVSSVVTYFFTRKVNDEHGSAGVDKSLKADDIEEI